LARLQIMRDRRDVPTVESVSSLYVFAGARVTVDRAPGHAVRAARGAMQCIASFSSPGDRMRPSNLLVLAGVSLALAACNNADPNRTTSVPPGVNNPTAVVAPITTPSAPPAPAERTPVAPNANTMAPGTNATIAFADANEQFAGP